MYICTRLIYFKLRIRSKLPSNTSPVQPVNPRCSYWGGGQPRARLKSVPWSARSSKSIKRVPGHYFVFLRIFLRYPLKVSKASKACMAQI
jgi:hypothetical protein